MTDMHPDEQPFIPPYYLLILTAVGVVIALIAFAQSSSNVIGWGGLGIALLSLVAWVFMAPEQARAALTGRTVRHGGTSLVVTIVVLTALIALYTLIRQANLRIDLTERDTFSLAPESEQAVRAFGTDPTIPTVKVLAFTSAAQAGQRDQLELLLSDYETVSNGKITWEFVNIDQNPLQAEQLGVTNAGQFYVAPLDEAGEMVTEKGELLGFFSQDDMTNAIFRVAAEGDFRAYFITVNNGLSMIGAEPTSMSSLRIRLEQQGWSTVREASLFEFAAPDSETQLNDPAADGEVMIIPGGDTPLADDELAIVTDYLDNGGKLVIFAGPSSNPDTTSLATGEGLSNYLWDHFGLRFRDDIVLDQTQLWQSPLIPVASDFNISQPITDNLPRRSGIIFEAPHSIELAETPPENVTVNELVTSTENAYAKTDFEQLIQGNIEPTADDMPGPFVLAAAAENSETGARIVLFGSASVVINQYQPLNVNNVVNFQAAVNSLAWVTHFDETFAGLDIQRGARPQDTPIFVDQQMASTISLITMLIIPFGILTIGLLVWWNNRETAH